MHTDGMAFSETGSTDVRSYQEENICNGSNNTLIQTPWNMTSNQGTSPECVSSCAGPSRWFPWRGRGGFLISQPHRWGPPTLPLIEKCGAITLIDSAHSTRSSLHSFVADLVVCLHISLSLTECTLTAWPFLKRGRPM